MNQETKEKYLYPTLVKLVVIFFAVATVFLFYRFDETKAVAARLVKILEPFLYGAVIAYLLNPMCNKIEGAALRLLDKRAPGLIKRHRIARFAGITLSMIFGGALVYGFMAFALPNIMDSIVSIIQKFPDGINRVSDWLETLARDNEKMQKLIETGTTMILTNFQNWLENSLMPNIQGLIAEVTSQVWNVFIVAKNFLIGLVACVYLMSQKDKLKYQGKLILLSVFGKKWSGRIREEIAIIDQMLNGFIVGKLIDSLIIGIICFVVLSILKWPYVVLVSTIIGVTNIIPFFGPFIGAVPCALLMLMESPRLMLYFLIFILILQQFDGNILGPKILGNTTGVSSLWILFSVTLFGGFWGLAGMIIGVPLFAVIYDLIRKLTYYVLHERGISKEEQEIIIHNKVEKEKN